MVSEMPLNKSFIRKVLEEKYRCPRSMKWIRKMVGMFPPRVIYDSKDLTAGALCLPDQELRDLGLIKLLRMREEVVEELKEEKKEELSKEELKGKIAGEERMEERLAE